MLCFTAENAALYRSCSLRRTSRPAAACSPGERACLARAVCLPVAPRTLLQRALLVDGLVSPAPYACTSHLAPCCNVLSWWTGLTRPYGLPARRTLLQRALVEGLSRPSPARSARRTFFLIWGKSF